MELCEITDPEKKKEIAGAILADRAMGFKELECLPTLWDEHNPCQIYVKYIGSAREERKEM